MTGTICIFNLNPLKSLQTKLTSDVNFTSWPGKSVNPLLSIINLTKTIKNLLEDSKITEKYL